MGYWLDLYLQNNRLSGVIGSSLGDYLGLWTHFDISGNFFHALTLKASGTTLQC